MKKYAIILPLLALPLLAYAAPFSGLSDYITAAGNIVRQGTLVLAGLALLVFFYGLMKFIFAGANGKVEGKNFMIWGVIALFVMVSVWGIVRFLQNEFLPGADFSAPPGLGGTGGIRI
jgi:hypothetical protein